MLGDIISRRLFLSPTEHGASRFLVRFLVIATMLIQSSIQVDASMCSSTFDCPRLQFCCSGECKSSCYSWPKNVNRPTLPKDTLPTRSGNDPPISAVAAIFITVPLAFGVLVLICWCCICGLRNREASLGNHIAAQSYPMTLLASAQRNTQNQRDLSQLPSSNYPYNPSFADNNTSAGSQNNPFDPTYIDTSPPFAPPAYEEISSPSVTQDNTTLSYTNNTPAYPHYPSTPSAPYQDDVLPGYQHNLAAAAFRNEILPPYASTPYPLDPSDEVPPYPNNPVASLQNNTLPIHPNVPTAQVFHNDIIHSHFDNSLPHHREKGEKHLLPHA